MARKRKAARKAPAKRKSAKRKTVKRGAAKTPARRRATKAAKPAGIGTRIAAAVGAVLGTLTDAEQLHARTASKAGVQELE